MLLVTEHEADFIILHIIYVEATGLNNLLPVSKQEVCYSLPDVSPTTVEAALAAMIRGGLVEKAGSARSTKYIKK